MNGRGPRRACARLAALAAAALLLMAAGPAHSDNALDMELLTDVVDGVEQPGLRIAVNAPLPELVLHLQRDDGRKLSQRFTTLDEGDRPEWRWEQPVGTARYAGSLKAKFADGSVGELPLSFALTVRPGLRIAVDRERFDLAGRSMWFALSGAAQRATYRVLGEQGQTLGEGTRDFAGEPAGTPLELRWEQTPGVVLRLDLTATDATGAFAKLELSPWSVEVEHEELHFASGKADIAPEEAPKLESTYHKLEEAVARYGSLVKLNLYIIGHTDTVGGKDYNRDLSMRRARAIAQWFKKRGFAFPILYQGFGEDVPAVPTPDETDEPRNRRAAYILAGDMPPSGPGVPRQDWQAAR